MREDNLEHFVCPSCHRSLSIESVEEREGDRIKKGFLICSTGQHRFPVAGFMPRFVSTDDATCAFGFEWNRHPRTQFDSVNGMRLSEDRFFAQTNWPRDLSGNKILEVGSGAGRFTEIALQTGATVFSVDASQAVDANWNNNGHHANLILCQASLYELPFPQDYFDKVFCFGVLQHTPNVALAFKKIAQFVRPCGELVVDVYNKNYWRNFHTPMYLIRPITKRIPHETLHHWLSRSVPRLLRISTWLRDHVPFIGRQLGALIPVANYNGVFPTDSVELLEQYSILDTFDTLSPKYISPQRPDTVRQWFINAGYQDIEFDTATVFYMRGRRKLAKNTTDIPWRSDSLQRDTEAAAF
jgi:2-polyprenyl-3-methyl-5-hydroxy-6-metoxy-1,4-benzoquinol methylase